MYQRESLRVSFLENLSTNTNSVFFILIAVSQNQQEHSSENGFEPGTSRLLKAAASKSVSKRRSESKDKEFASPKKRSRISDESSSLMAKIYLEEVELLKLRMRKMEEERSEEKEKWAIERANLIRRNLMLQDRE